jgi:hypothetical protein
MHVKSRPNARALKNVAIFETFPARGLLIALAIMLVPGVAQARVRWVGASSGCDSATIQGAINQASNGDEVRITKDGGYQGEWYGQALSINNKNLTIGGNWDYCGQPDAQYSVGYQVVSGFGGTRAPVITIRGTSNVSLYGLLISLGDPSSASNPSNLGGGIDFRGDGSLSLRTVILQYNVGIHGGAIHVACQGNCSNTPTPTLTLADNVYFYDNTATLGGGVFLGVYSKLNMKNAYTLFHRNRATLGGAIFMDPEAAADIGSPHPANVAGVFYQNTATYAGGAIYVYNNGGGSGQNPTINLYSTSATEPLSFIENEAPLGAAVAVVSNMASIGKEVCATHAYFHGNRSTAQAGQEGSIVFVRGSGAGFSVNSSDCIYQIPDDAAGCGRMDESRCDQFSENFTGISEGHVFDAQLGGRIFLRRVHVDHNVNSENTNSALLRVVNADSLPTSTISMEDSVIDHNAIVKVGVVNSNNAAVSMRHVTIADNTRLNSFFGSIFANYGGLIAVSNSIIDLGTEFELASEFSGSTLMDFVLASNARGYSQAGADPDLFIGAPSYIPGFYRLQPYSEGIDRAMVSIGDAAEFDSDGTRRNIDNRSINNIPDYFADLGAYESTATSIPPDLDTIFASSFEPLTVSPQ